MSRTRTRCLITSAAAAALLAAPGAAPAMSVAPRPFALVGVAVNALARTAPATIVAGTTHGAYRSTNGGKTWRRVALAGDVGAVVVDRRSATTLYAGVGTTVWRSRNAGASWQRLGPVRQVSPPDIVGIAASGSTVAVSTGGEAGGVFLSRNAGASWRSVGGFSFASVIGIALQPTGPRGLWVAGDFGAASLALSGGGWAIMGSDYGIPVNPGAAGVTFPGGTGHPVWISRCGEYYSLDESQIGQYQFVDRGTVDYGNPRIVSCGVAVTAPIRAGAFIAPGRFYVGVCSNRDGCYATGRLARLKGRGVTAVALGDPVKRGGARRILIGTLGGLTAVPLPAGA